MFERLKDFLHRFATAQPGVLDKNAEEAEESWENARWAVAQEIRPQLEQCARALSTSGRKVLLRYNSSDKCAELVDHKGLILAEVEARHGDMVFNYAKVISADHGIRELLVKAIITAHPRVNVEAVGA